MVPISQRVEIMAPADRVWSILSDPLAVARCIPGATLAPGEGANSYAGTIRVKFGPTRVSFAGEMTLAYDHEARRCTIEGRGRDSRGASNALATGVVAAEGSEPVTLTVDGEFDVSGPLEAFARTGGVHVAQALLAEFGRNLEARIGGADADATPTSAAPAEAQGIGGFGLLWRAFRAWLGGLGRAAR